MTPLAATATAESAPLWWRVLVGAVVLAVYAGLCWVRPFADCMWCRGTGTRGTRGRSCLWCRGRQHRLRWGRRAWNAYARAVREARVRDEVES
jgi:hypothetical protein